MYLHEFRNWKTWLSVNYRRCDWAFSFLAVMKSVKSKSCFRSCHGYKCAFRTGPTSKQWLMRICDLVDQSHHYLSSLQFYGQNQRRRARTFSDGDPAFCPATGESGNAEIFWCAAQADVYAGISLFNQKSSLYRHDASAYCWRSWRTSH